MYCSCYISDNKNNSPMVKWLSLVTLNHTSEVRTLVGESFVARQQEQEACKHEYNNLFLIVHFSTLDCSKNKMLFDDASIF